MSDEPGALALFGAATWAGSSELAAQLIASAGGEVVALPTGAAYEMPSLAIERLGESLAELGATIHPVMVLTRRDAEVAEYAEVVRSASLICLTGGSPLHLMSVMKDSLVLTALIAAWRDGATVIGAEGGASVLSDPMIDPRGGALTVGLGLVRDLSVYVGYRGEIDAGLERTLALAADDCPVVAIGADGGVVRDPDGIWRTEGAVTIFQQAVPVDLTALAGKRLA